MIRVIRHLFSRLWQRLSRRKGPQALSRFALVMLFGLDIVVLVATMDGLNNVARVVDLPSNRISSRCKEMTADLVAVEAAHRVESIRNLLIPDSSSRDRLVDELNNQPAALKACQRVYSLFLALIHNQALLALYSEYDGRFDQIRSVEAKIAELKHSYEAALLEKVARQKRADSILPASASEIKDDIARLQSELKDLQQRQAATKTALDTHPAVLSYFEQIQLLMAGGELQRAQREFEHEKFTFPYRIMVAQLGFMLPLLLLAIGWNVRAIRRQDDNQIQFSSHFMLVCLLPVFIRVLQFVYELLPKYLLEEIWADLAEMNLMFLFNYGVIICGLAGGLLLIYTAQRTYFKPARQRVLRLRKVQCLGCGEKLPSSEQSCCEVCGTEQLGNCRHCGLRTRALAFYCQHCGAARD